MTTQIHRAIKTRSNRPGWSVTFSHPRRNDARGKFGLKVRKGLGTTDDAEADRLVEQINTLLNDETWWSVDRRAEAEQRFDRVAVSVFFDGIESGSSQPRELRERIIPLPSADDGYAKVMLVGSTGAGKTTLLRQFIGSDHTRDRFPSTSTAKTTTAEIEIITATGPYEAVVTFMTEHEVRCAVTECLEQACADVVRGHDDAGVAGSLLEHREQRFRLSYILGTWQQAQPSGETDAQYEMQYEYGDEASETDTLSDDEIVAGSELAVNNERLGDYVARIRKIGMAVQEQKAAVHGAYGDLANATQRQVWLEDFTDGLYENPDFSPLSWDIMDRIAERFDLVQSRDYELSETVWPILWHYEEKDRDTFLRQVRWFTGNHGQQFGRLLTPLVNGIRVRGSFQPYDVELQDDDRRLVLLDGEGLGHSAREATSVSTKVTERFPETDMILLVDNAQSPMQAAPLELLRSVGSSGHGDKLAIVFTHFDQVRGDNLGSHSQKVNYVRASVGNAIVSLRESLGAPVTEILEGQLSGNDFYLGSLNQPTGAIPRGFIRDMRSLMERMQQSAKRDQPIDAAPVYNLTRLEVTLLHATDGFRNRWEGLLGLSYSENIRKVHWGRVKALCRRIANVWDKEYGDLRPVADLVRQLQDSISQWLDHPAGWTRHPADEGEGQAVINQIRQKVYADIHVLAERRLLADHQLVWETAYRFSGPGSSFARAKEMRRIYDAAAPSISSLMDEAATQEFLDQAIRIVGDAVEDAGGSVEGIVKRGSASEEVRQS